MAAVAPCAATAATVGVIHALPAPADLRDAEVVLLARAALLVVAGHTLLAIAPPRARPARLLPPVLHAAAALAILGVLLTATAYSGGSGPPPLWVAAVAGAAFAEEYVFRCLLPLRVARGIPPVVPRGTAVVIATVLPQLAFAVSHVFVRGMGAGLAPYQWLFAAGVLLAIVVRVAGLWAGALLHALANVGALGPAAAMLRPAHVLAVLAIAAAGCLLAARPWASGGLPRRSH